MSKNSDKMFEYFLKVESLYLGFRKSENEFIISWNKFKNNPQKFIITNSADAKFYADCERFTKLIIETCFANKKLDKKWDELILDIEKSKRGIVK